MLAAQPYPLIAQARYTAFHFYSQGPKGSIAKAIRFELLNNFQFGEVYNIGFGDLDEHGVVNDLVVTDNKDSDRILATVAAAAVLFCDRHPHARLFAKGSTASRSRYYAMSVAKYLDIVGSVFEISGSIDGIRWEKFRPNVRYTVLLAKRIRLTNLNDL